MPDRNDTRKQNRQAETAAGPGQDRDSAVTEDPEQNGKSAATGVPEQNGDSAVTEGPEQNGDSTVTEGPESGTGTAEKKTGGMTLRRALAVFGIMLLLSLYGINIVLALMGTDTSRQILKITLTLSIAVPILLYIILMLVRKNPGGPRDQLTEEQKIEIRRRMQGEEPDTSPEDQARQAEEAKRLGRKAEKFRRKK